MSTSSIEYGNVAEWVGIVVTVITIWLTIRFYSNDNKTKIYTRILYQAIYKDKNSEEFVESGITLEYMNAGKISDRVKFEGLVSEYTFLEKIIRWILRWFSKYSNIAEDGYQKFSHSSYYPTAELFNNNTFELIEPLITTKSIPITEEALIQVMSDCVKTNKRQQKKICEKKPLIFHLILSNFSGTEYKKSFIVKETDTRYHEIINKIGL